METKQIKDKKGQVINEGDRINITGLETIVTGFSIVAGQDMVDTKYGSFNPDLVELIRLNN